MILGGSRTPIGSYRGVLAAKSATSLGAAAIQGALKQSNLSPDQVDEVYMGNVLGANLGQAPARQAALQAGLCESTVCTTINKVCASGMKAVMLGAQSIALGLQKTVVAGGMESMSNTPYYLPNARGGFGYGHQTVLDGIIKDGLWCAHYQIHMGECAEETAKEYSISRQEQDDYAILSYRRAAQASTEGRFTAELVPISMEDTFSKKKATSRGIPKIINEDEEPCKIDYTKVPTLRSVFKSDGTVTAANASTISDGASALIMTHEDYLKGRADGNACQPLGRLLAIADAECNPKLFTIAPSLVIPLVLERAGVGAEQVDLWEINEAFSAVALANIKILHLDPAKVNVNGGAVSLGHPIGSSGCRIIVSLLHQLRKGQIGVAAICNGGGGASAVAIERL